MTRLTNDVPTWTGTAQLEYWFEENMVLVTHNEQTWPAGARFRKVRCPLAKSQIKTRVASDTRIGHMCHLGRSSRTHVTSDARLGHMSPRTLVSDTCHLWLASDRCRLGRLSRTRVASDTRVGHVSWLCFGGSPYRPMANGLGRWQW